MRKRKRKTRFVVTFVAVAIALAFYLLTAKLPTQPQPQPSFQLPSGPTLGRSEILIPAVARIGGEERGVVARLEVQVIEGEGRTLTNIENLLFWIDTQYSIRVAKHVASREVGTDFSRVDLIYSIETNASIIEGQSAGAALTIATIAAAQNKTINPKVLITGTIEEDGTIGPVGGIVKKAQAAKEVGAEIFLVPHGQSKIKTAKPVEKCEQLGFITYCVTEYRIEEINITEEVGIRVEEVVHIKDALPYFLEGVS